MRLFLLTRDFHFPEAWSKQDEGTFLHRMVDYEYLIRTPSGWAPGPETTYMHWEEAPGFTTSCANTTVLETWPTGLHVVHTQDHDVARLTQQGIHPGIAAAAKQLLYGGSTPEFAGHHLAEQLATAIAHLGEQMHLENQDNEDVGGMTVMSHAYLAIRYAAP